MATLSAAGAAASISLRMIIASDINHRVDHLSLWKLFHLSVSSVLLLLSFFLAMQLGRQDWTLNNQPTPTGGGGGGEGKMGKTVNIIRGFCASA
jgi:hypothetical protein